MATAAKQLSIAVEFSYVAPLVPQDAVKSREYCSSTLHSALKASMT